MKKILLSLLILSFLSPLALAQDLTRAPDLNELGDNYTTEVVERPDGTVEIIRKYEVFEEVEIPVYLKNLLVRENIGYDTPVLDNDHILSPQDVSRDPMVIGTNALLAILIFLIVGLASFLFNNVIEAHGEGINKFLRRIPILRSFIGDSLKKRSFFKKLFLLILLLLFGLIAAHINPDFNIFEQRNLGIIVVTVVAIIVATYAKDFWRLAVARRNGWEAFFKPNILGLLLAVGCVVLSRNLEIPPGYLFGIPMGLFIFSKQFHKNEGKFEFSALTWMFFMAMVVWFVTPYTKDYEVIFDLFNLLYVILLEGLFFELIPLKFLPGKEIYAWSKFAWALIFSIVSFLLLHTLFNPNSTIGVIQESKPTTNTLMILGVFVLVSFVIWGIAKLRLKFSNN